MPICCLRKAQIRDEILMFYKSYATEAAILRNAKKNIFWLSLVVAVYLFGYGNSAQADWPNVDIDLSTCQPKGMVANLKEKVNPKDFWISQYTRLSMAFEDGLDPSHNPTLHCAAKQGGLVTDQVSYFKCVGFYSNRRLSIGKCMAFSRTMCRHLGGFC